MLRLTALIPLASALFLTLAGCAAMEQEYREKNCNTEAGYEKGVNDAQGGQPMDSSFASECEASSKGGIMASYRQGYESISNRMSFDAGPGGVVINAPGVNVNVGNGSRWGCEIHIFGKTYRGSGRSRDEAADHVRGRCEAEQNPMHCEEMDCAPRQ